MRCESFESSFYSMRHAARRRVALLRGNDLSRQKGPQLVVGVPREKLAQALAPRPLHFEAMQQALDRVGHLGRGAAIADRPRDRCVRAEGAADAEVVGVGAAELLAFDPDVGDPVLAATVRASG